MKVQETRIQQIGGGIARVEVLSTKSYDPRPWWRKILDFILRRRPNLHTLTFTRDGNLDPDIGVNGRIVLNGTIQDLIDQINASTAWRAEFKKEGEE